MKGKMVRVNLYPEEGMTKHNGEDGWLIGGIFFPKKCVEQWSEIGRTYLVPKEEAEEFARKQLEACKKGDE